MWVNCRDVPVGHIPADLPSGTNLLILTNSSLGLIDPQALAPLAHSLWAIELSYNPLRAPLPPDQMPPNTADTPFINEYFFSLARTPQVFSNFSGTGPTIVSMRNASMHDLKQPQPAPILAGLTGIGQASI